MEESQQTVVNIARMLMEIWTRELISTNYVQNLINMTEKIKELTNTEVVYIIIKQVERTKWIFLKNLS